MATEFWKADHKYYWVHFMGGAEGKVEEPEYVYVGPEERWSPKSPWYLTRENFGRHRCPACGKPYVFRDSAWNCHRAASAYIVWREFAYTGPAGARSLGDTIRAEISNPYGAFGSYYGGGPYGL